MPKTVTSVTTIHTRWECDDCGTVKELVVTNGASASSVSLGSTGTKFLDSKYSNSVLCVDCNKTRATKELMGEVIQSLEDPNHLMEVVGVIFNGEDTSPRIRVLVTEFRVEEGVETPLPGRRDLPLATYSRMIHGSRINGTEPTWKRVEGPKND